MEKITAPHISGKRPLFVTCLIWFLLTFPLCGCAEGEQFHLYPSEKSAPSGEHHYNGLWQIKAAAPGDVVYLHDENGHFKDQLLFDGWKGTQENPITIKAAEGEKPHIMGYIDVQNSEFLIFEGLTITDSPYAGVLIQKNSHHIAVQHCRIHHNALGVWIANGAGMSNQIVENEIYANETHGISAVLVNCQKGAETVLARNRVYENGYMGFEINANYYVIEANIVYENGFDYPGSSGIHLFSLNPTENSGDHNVIRYNISYNNSETDGPDGNGIQLDQWCDDNMVYYNLCYGNDGPGISVFDSSDNQIYNNTLYGNLLDPGDTHYVKGEIILASDYTKNIDGTRNNTLINNLCVAVNPSAHAVYIDEATSDNALEIMYNLLYHQAGGDLYLWKNRGGDDITAFNNMAGCMNNIYAPPDLLAETPRQSEEFGLQENAAAIDRGIQIGLNRDLAGNRILSRPDIGAFEYQPTSIFAPSRPVDLRISDDQTGL